MPDKTITTALVQVALAARLTLGIVFLLSALPKLRRPSAFTRSVVAYEMLPTGVARVFSLALIPLEVSLALAFLTGRLIGVALPLVAALLLTFLIAVVVNLRRGRRVPCGCFGEASEAISPRTAARLLLLLAVALLLAITEGAAGAAVADGRAADTVGSMVVSLLPTIALAGFLVLLGAWLLRLPELVSLVRQLRPRRTMAGSPVGGNGVEGT